MKYFKFYATPSHEKHRIDLNSCKSPKSNSNKGYLRYSYRCKHSYVLGIRRRNLLLHKFYTFFPLRRTQRPTTSPYTNRSTVLRFWWWKKNHFVLNWEKFLDIAARININFVHSEWRWHRRTRDTVWDNQCKQQFIILSFKRASWSEFL